MKKFILSIAACALVGPFAQAELLNLEAGEKTIEGVNVASKASLTRGDKSTELPLLGSGLRQKRVLLSDVNVYVTQVFADSTEKFVREEAKALASMEQMSTVAIRMTFLRTVEAEKVQASFKEALIVNDIDISKADVVQFLSIVENGGEAKKGGSLTILLERNAGQEMVTYEDTEGHTGIVQGQAGLVQSLLSIWFGVPADSGLKKLKGQLISGL